MTMDNKDFSILNKFRKGQLVHVEDEYFAFSKEVALNNKSLGFAIIHNEAIETAKINSRGWTHFRMGQIQRSPIRRFFAILHAPFAW